MQWAWASFHNSFVECDEENCARAITNSDGCWMPQARAQLTKHFPFEVLAGKIGEANCLQRHRQFSWARGQSYVLKAKVEEPANHSLAGAGRKTILCTLLMFANAGFAENRPNISLQSTDVPESVTRLFKTTRLDRQYDFSSHLKPSYLSGDFDGDGRPDFAILVKHKTSQKTGIAVCHFSTNKILLIGAGTTVGNGGDDFDWMDQWKVYPKGAVRKGGGRARGPVLKGDALHVEKSESASALIYWNGRRYVWHQQGD